MTNQSLKIFPKKYLHAFNMLNQNLNTHLETIHPETSPSVSCSSFSSLLGMDYLSFLFISAPFIQTLSLNTFLRSTSFYQC